MAFPKLGEMALGDFWRGIFFIGLLATIMSTLDSVALLSAMTFGRDLLWRLKPNSNINRNTQIGFFVIISLSILVILFLPSVVKIWYTFGTLFIPALLIPVICNFTKYNYKSSVMFTGMLGSFFATLIWFIIGMRNGSIMEPIYLFNIQPFFIGLLSWLLFLPFLVDRFTT